MLVLIHSHLASEFPELLAEMQQRHPGHELVAVDDRTELKELLPEADAVLTARLERDEIEAAEKLRVHFIPYAGADKIDFDLYVRRGIAVSSNHGNAPAVAERAIALALAVLGRIVEFHNDLAAGRWHRTGNPHQPFDYWSSLRGKSCGILGTGAIGSSLARMLVGFECPLIGLNSSGKNPNPALFHATTARLEELLAEAAVVFVTLPLTSATAGLIGAQQLDQLAGGVLVNISRGEIVEEEALYRALRNGSLAGAGIDTWYNYPSPPHAECMPSRFPFSELRNVVMSPHAGSHTIEGKRGQFEAALAQLDAYLEHGTLDGLVPAERKY